MYRKSWRLLLKFGRIMAIENLKMHLILPLLFFQHSQETSFCNFWLSYLIHVLKWNLKLSLEVPGDFYSNLVELWLLKISKSI